VYWVHIELVYGRWFGFWKESLTYPQVVLFSAVLIGLMTLLSILRTRGSSPGSALRRPATVAVPGSVAAD
jgi:hypothetical protein